MLSDSSKRRAESVCNGRGPGPCRAFNEARAGSRGDAGLASAQVVKPDMWIDVVIVALLLGVGAFLNQADWHARFLARIRTATPRGGTAP